MTKSISVWYWIIVKPYVCPFLLLFLLFFVVILFFKNFLLDNILLTLYTKHHVINAEHAQTKKQKLCNRIL